MYRCSKQVQLFLLDSVTYVHGVRFKYSFCNVCFSEEMKKKIDPEQQLSVTTYWRLVCEAKQGCQYSTN